VSGPATAYALVGGELGVRAQVDRFYDLMDLEPELAQRLGAAFFNTADWMRSRGG